MKIQQARKELIKALEEIEGLARSKKVRYHRDNLYILLEIQYTIDQTIKKLESK